ncbi:DNA ligase [Bermanella sp. R86510]|uniref:DNA ligase n=1 Tax=unclassified Bermanella TaxID=2627862 RepID=UPI0037CCB1E8
MHTLWILCLCFILLAPFCVAASSQLPPLTLATTFQPEQFSGAYWVSEKLDGMRCYWDGEQLLTRNGHVIHAPDYFTNGLPNTPLDGELWLGRNQYQALMRIVRDQIPNPTQWQQVTFQVFDLPSSSENFETRQRVLKDLIADMNQPHVQWVQQHKLDSFESIHAMLDEVIAQNGEGLMLRTPSSRYESGRSAHLLKYKLRQDDEAKVIAYQTGKGKYKDMMGAIWVEKEDGTLFKIGTGFSDDERQDPPPIGSQITYSYQGFTERGLPRFASFERVRQPE